MPIVESGLDLSHDKIAEQINKQVILKICDAYGLRIEDWEGTLVLKNVERYDGSIVDDLKVPVKLILEVKEDDDAKTSRGGFNGARVRMSIKPKFTEVVHGVPHILRDKSPVNFSAYCSTIQHELQHHIDSLIHDEETNKRNKAPKKDERASKDEYYTSVNEFRAFLRQLVYVIEVRSSRLIEKELGTLDLKERESVFDANLHDFVKFLEDTKVLTPGLKNFIEANKSVPEHWSKIEAILEKAQKSLKRRYDYVGYSGA